MKFSFKRIAVSAILSAVLTLSGVSVFAVPDDPTAAVKIGETYDLTTKGAYFTQSNSEGNKATSVGGYFTTDAKVDSAGPNLKNNGYALKLLTPSDESGCKLVITDTNKKDYIVSYQGDSGAVTENSGGAEVFTTKVIPKNKIVTITGNTSSSTKIKEITVKTGATPTSYHEISGTVKVGGEAKADIPVVLTGSDYVANEGKATTDASGKYTFTNIGNIEKVTISIEATDEYFGDSKDVSESDNNVTGIDFDLKVKEKALTVESPVKVNLVEGLSGSDNDEVPNDTIIGKYFKVVNNGTVSGNYLKMRANDTSVYALETSKQEGGNLEFTTSQKFDVIITCSSNGANTSDIVLRKTSGDTNVGDVYTCSTSDIHSAYVVKNLEAGTYQILSPKSGKGGNNTSRGVRLYTVEFTEVGEAKTANTAAPVGSDYSAVDTVNGNTYIIHPITEGEMAKSTLSLANAGGTAIANTDTDTAYTAVQFADESILNASDIGADTIFAICVTGTNGATPKAKFTWIAE